MLLLDEDVDVDTAITLLRLRAVQLPAREENASLVLSEAAAPAAVEMISEMEQELAPGMSAVSALVVPTEAEAPAPVSTPVRRLDPIDRAIVRMAADSFWGGRAGDTCPLPDLQAHARLEVARERGIRQATGNLVAACQTIAEMHAQEAAEMQAFIRRINDRMGLPM
jgi:hypothetical protein